MNNRIQIFFCYKYIIALVLLTISLRAGAQQTKGETVLFSYTFTVVPESDEKAIFLDGSVISGQDGMALPGVTIKKLPVTTIEKGTQTDLDGNFQLYTSVGDTLEVSSVGFISQKIIVENDNTLTITLEEDVPLITTEWGPGYMVQKKIYSTELVTIKKPSLFKRILTKIGNLFR